ncbi:MAG: bifunctional glutamate N-acetyltransferase/amino-acid acetyltransferase ArgJ [Clostridiales bacterium]|nr:bifunctional glutamate N-acetyltransferase/amino-acid acetyltransferase ArgJ [Clostridiales bacterium]
MRKIPGGVTAAKGFSAACCAAGIKYQGRTDMAMIVSDSDCAAAGTFTTNLVKAAPVVWDQRIVYEEKKARAVVVNAGIANAATGKEGMRLCKQTAAFTGEILGIPESRVLLGSTGVIGPQIPLDRITAGVAAMKETLSSSLEAGTAASRAIMTTDTVNKEFAVEFDLPGGDGSVPVRLGGMSKGSGMIHPNMCTMLGYITTDCAIDQALLQKALKAAVQDTFNMISVDGDTSTNDTLLVLANGQAGNTPITAEDESYAAFCEALFSVCRDLAVKMAGDGEGATRLMEMRVYNADTKDHARTLAKAVIASSLVKAMVFGRDANCGRILCALGYAGAPFDPEKIEVYLHGENGETLTFYDNGCVLPFDEEKALEMLSGTAVRFSCNMNMGKEEATAWGCDLTYDYVKINGDYRS